MSNINRKIAKEIILAQIASDAGKGDFYYIINGESADNARKYGYSVKQSHIFNAIKCIDNCKNCNFKYWVTMDNGMPIVYFETKICNRKLQISFHNPGWDWLKSKSGKGCGTRWDNWGAGSRAACYLIAKYYDLQ